MGFTALKIIFEWNFSIAYSNKCHNKANLRESVAIGHLCVLMLEHKTLTYYHEILGGDTSGSN